MSVFVSSESSLWSYIICPLAENVLETPSLIPAVNQKSDTAIKHGRKNESGLNLVIFIKFLTLFEFFKLEIHDELIRSQGGYEVIVQTPLNHREKET